MYVHGMFSKKNTAHLHSFLPNMVQTKAPNDLTSSKCLVFVPQSLNSRIRKRFNNVTCPVFNLHRDACVLMNYHFFSVELESQYTCLGGFPFSRLEKWYLSLFHRLLPWHAAATACPAIRSCTCAPRLQWFT